MSKRIAIIDGDVLCYQAFKPRWKDNITHEGVGVTSLSDTGETLEKTYTREEDAKYLRESWERLKKTVPELAESLYCSDYLMAVQGNNNFRKSLYLDYKKDRGTRRPSELSRFVPKLRQLCVLEDFAVASHGREADDLLRIWAEEARANDIEFIIVSIDKDLLCIPGKHHLLHKNKTIEVSEEEARQLYFGQLLKGDPTDNIPGLPKIGDVKAQKLLEGCKSLEDFQEVVVNAYLEAYGDEWYNYLLINGKLIHIQKHEHDYFDLDSWPIVEELS